MGTFRIIEEINGERCYLHHTATCRGYISRRLPDGIARKYDGRFGRGYKRLLPSWNSTLYCTVEYWIRCEEGE